MEISPVVQRRKRHYFAGAAVILVALGVNYKWTNNYEELAVVTSLPAMVVLASHLVWRLCLLVEEVFHMKRLNLKFADLIKRVGFNNYSVLIFTGLIFFSSSWISNPIVKSSIPKIFCHIGPVPFCTSTFASCILFFMTKAEQCATWEVHTMRDFNGLDYGSGMAHSYFHGYLKLILPAKGDNRSIRDRIVWFLEEQKLSDSCFPVKKLIIMIPRSGYSYPKFSDDPSQNASNPDIEAVKSLQDHLQDRAGTEKRVYRGGAYRIRMETGKEEYMYIVAEGATPLLTFQEAYSSSTPEAEHLREQKVDIVSNFYRTLVSLIEGSKDCKDLVELIYYDDENITSPSNLVSLLREFLLNHQ